MWKQTVAWPAAYQQLATTALPSRFDHTPALLLLQLEELLRERDMQLRKMHKQLENREGEVSSHLAKTSCTVQVGRTTAALARAYAHV